MALPYKYKTLLWIAPLVLLLDQLTKFFIVKTLSIGQELPVVPGIFDIVHYRNAGAAFGMLANLDVWVRDPFFYGISAVALLAMIIIFRHLDLADHFFPYPLSLITGGILGNFVDRVRFGNVVDFLSFHIYDWKFGSIPLEWPAFNVADSAITVSMVLLAAHMLRQK